MNCNMKRLIVAVGLVFSLLAIEATAQSTSYTSWSSPVNLGPVVNSPYLDACVTVSKNNLSLFFRSNRPVGGIMANRLWVAKRASPDEPWGTPQLVPNFNDGFSFSCPGLSPDEHRMYFVTARPESCGGADLWVSRRHDRRDDFGWESPVNLGCELAGFVNSTLGESTPAIFEDETGTEVLYFGGDRGIRQSRMRPDGTFGPSNPVSELLPGSAPAVRRDGLEIIFMSNRPGGAYLPPASSMWTSARTSTNHPWSTPVPLPELSSGASEGGRMCFSFDGRAFYFYSARPGGVSPAPELIPTPAWAYWDLYVATREKLRY